MVYYCLYISHEHRTSSKIFTGASKEPKGEILPLSLFSILVNSAGSVLHNALLLKFVNNMSIESLYDVTLL